MKQLRLPFLLSRFNICAIHPSKDDHSNSVLLLWKGMTLYPDDHLRLRPQDRHLHQEQVVADLWERYLHLLDEGKEDGYVCSQLSLL